MQRQSTRKEIRCSTDRYSPRSARPPRPRHAGDRLRGLLATGAVVFSRASHLGNEGTVESKGGLYAAKDGRLNQLTEDPTDSEPAFSADGRKIAFVRGGDVFAMRRRRLRPAPADQRRRARLGGRSRLAQRPLRRLRAAHRRAAGLRPTSTRSASAAAAWALAHRRPRTSTKRSFSPDGRAIVFVRGMRRDRRRRQRGHLLGPALGRRPGAPDPHRRHRRVRAPLLRRRHRLQPRREQRRARRLRRRLHDAPRRQRGEAPRSPAPARPSSKTFAQRPHAALPPRPGPLGEADRPGPGPQAQRARPTARRPTRLLLRRPPGRGVHRRSTKRDALAIDVGNRRSAELAAGVHSPESGAAPPASARSSPGSRYPSGPLTSPPVLLAIARQGNSGVGCLACPGDITAAWANLRSARRSPATGSTR